MHNFRSLLLVRVRSIFMSIRWQHQKSFSCPHSSKVVRKSFGNCIPITYLPFCNRPDKSRQVLLRQAAENPEVVKDVHTSVVKDISTSFGKTRWQNMKNLGRSAINIAGGCAAFFSWKSDSKQSNARLDTYNARSNARLDADNARARSDARLDDDNARWNARWDAYDARFEKVSLGIVSLSLGMPALLMIGIIGSIVLKEKVN
jgi:hypothetical protein